MNNKIQTVVTTSSLIIFFFLFSSTNDVLVVVSADPNTTYVQSACSPASTDADVLRIIALEVIDNAVDKYQGPGEKASCAYVSDQKPYNFYASAVCWGDISVQDCKDCLWNAQFRLVDHYCRFRYGGRLMLSDCFLRFEDYGFCSSVS